MTFNQDLYNRLSGEDKMMIDEYCPKMTIDEINSFMDRLVNYVELDGEVLETKEELDAIIAFENSLSILKPGKKIAIPLDLIIQHFNMKIGKKQKIYPIIENYFNNNSKNKMWLCEDLLKVEAGIRKLYLESIKNENGIYKLKNVLLSLSTYTYRICKNKEYRRLGIVLDKYVLDKTNGYGRNFKIIDVKIKHRNGLDMTPYIKHCGYWKPNNAISNGFDNRTGIIWFDGKVSDVGDKWYFDNNTFINTFKASVNIIIATDAFVKKFQRFGIKKIIKEAIFKFESAHQM